MFSFNSSLIGTLCIKGSILLLLSVSFGSEAFIKNGV